MHHLINQTDNDEYYLTILNNSGVSRTVAHGDQLLHEADKTVHVTLKENRELVVLEGNASISRDTEGYLVSLPAGGWFVGKF